VSFFVLGCGGGDLVGLDDPAFDSDNDGILNEVDACPGEPETLNRIMDADGCPDTPLDFYEAIRVDLEQYWTSAFPTYGETYRPIGVFSAFSDATTTGCGVVYPQNVEYCSRGEAVYYDLNMLLTSLDLVGAMGPAFILSHAVGGHISWLLEWSLWLTPKTLRLQADCWAGAWASDATARGWLEVAEPEIAVGQIVRIDEAPGTWFDASRYGTPDQRVAAFQVGFVNGPPGCASVEFFDI
jgi:predicted metalloprotease